MNTVPYSVSLESYELNVMTQMEGVERWPIDRLWRGL